MMNASKCHSKIKVIYLKESKDIFEKEFILY